MRGTIGHFHFDNIKLLDFTDQFDALLPVDNSFGVAVVGHLKANLTKQDSQLRKQWKLKLLKLLFERSFDLERIVGLFKFIDWLLRLPEGLELEFRNELTAYEQERRMPYITSIERIGREEGRAER